MPLDLTRLTRRQLLAGMGLGGVALATAGCAANSQGSSGSGGGGGAGSGGGGGGATSKGSAGATSSVKRGGTLRAGIGSDLVPADFYTNSSDGITTVIGLVYDSLIRYPNDRVVPTPRLATSWKLSADGRTLTLDLRQGVKFHTGRPFTSKDAAFSLQTYALPKWTGQEESTAAAISDYDTSDPNRIVLGLAHPMTNIFDLLDTVPIVDKETFAGVGTGKQYVGTGPFKFVSWTPTSSLKFTRNPDYWRPGLPYLDAVDVAVVPDATSLTTQLRSGQIDLDNGSSYLDIKELVDTNRFGKIQLVGAEDQIYVGTNIRHPDLSDLKVRQAIAYALDRDRIMTEVFVGSGYAVNLPWPKYSVAYSAARNKTYGYDPARAKQLVAAHGQKIATLPYNFPAGNPLYESTVQIVQANLAAVGIEVSLEPLESAQFTKQLISATLPGIWSTFHSWAQYTPSTLTVSAYPFNAAHNSSHYRTATYTKDALAAWEASAPDSAQAKAAYDDLSRDLLDALFLIEIGIVQQQWAVSTGLHGVSYTKRSELQLTDAWLES